MTTIITKNSSTSTAVPASGDLTKGELAVNVTDKKLYTKDNSGTVVKLVGSLGNQEASAAAITGGTSAGVAITGGTINNTPIGATTAAAVTGTTVTATTGFVGALTGDVTGNTTGTHTGAVTGNVTGNLTGNVTASTGTSSFNNVTINGGLDMNAGTTATITNLTTPTNSGDAATKGYVDTSIAAVVNGAPAALDTLNELAAALGNDSSFATTVTNSIAGKLPLAGGTMTGAIAMGTNKITGLGTPTAGTDAATKTYVDTSAAAALPLAGGTMTGNIVMGSNKVTSTATPTTNDDLTRKGYVDSILGSATSAATSAANAATSETNAANSASAASTSASNASASASAAAASYDSFDDRYLGPKSSAPSVDNDGNALLTGALYWNSTVSTLYVWTGSAWTQAAFTASGFLTAGNNLSDVSSASTSRTNLGLGTAATMTGPSGTIVGTTDSQTLTNKTLTTPTLTTPNITTGLTIAGSAGTSGQVLTSAGSGAAPTWSSPSAGAMTLLATVTASNSATVSFNNTYITSTYKAYVVMISGWVPDTDRPLYQLQLSSNNLSTFVTCYYATTRVDGTNIGVRENTNGTEIRLISPGTFGVLASDGGASGSVYIYNPASTVAGKTLEWFMGGYSVNSSTQEIWNGTATYRTTATAINAIRFSQDSGNIAQGTFKLYGIT
jgi:hypothetical protein